ncbi:membrane protein YczE [Microbacterium aurantiacum]|uniref:membrane protein YczE n=1 Tax=Microbacterium aurantiacum TaxID=162393 RepID=UPI004036D883
MTSRLVALVFGLVLFGFGCALIVLAGLGVDPWTVLAQGISVQTGWGIGWVTNLVGLAVLLLWIPLRQRPGVGTIANIALVGTTLQISLGFLPSPTNPAGQAAFLVGGVAVIGLASGIYIGARLGPGPRDGLMTGLNARFGWPLWACRAGVESTVLLIGLALGGSVGIGTVVFAVTIGPAVHASIALVDRIRSSSRIRLVPARRGLSAPRSAANRSPGASSHAVRSSRSPSTDTCR